MGVVVAARHEQLGVSVALKFMLPEALGDASMKERFLREAQAAGRLRSEHVARVMDFGTLPDGAPYIVMEYLSGSDLHDLLAQSGTLAPHEAALYVVQACKAMQEAHGQGIIHRDLKPQNLFLTHRPDGTPLVKVLDFGISKLTGPESSLSVTSSSAMMGSPLYMAPEQIRSSKKVDARADIYSLGAILYQLLTGQVPIPAETLGELFEHVFTRPTTPPRALRPELPAELDAVVMRCLAKSPDDRFQSVDEMALALTPFIDPRRSLPSFRPDQPAAPFVAAATTGVGPTTTLGKGATVMERDETLRPVKRGRAVLAWGGAGLLVAALGVAGFTLRSMAHPGGASPAANAAPVAPPVVAPPPPASTAPAASVVVLDPAGAAGTAPSASPSASVAARPPLAGVPSAAAPARPQKPVAPTAAPLVAAPPAAPAPAPKPAATAKPAADPFGSPD
jgi:serine/threonine-protein kinase